MIKITCLCDNINNHKKFWATEGNSILIETNGIRILYDVGRDGRVLEHNLEVLGLSISHLDYIILSHAHKGHSGALSNISLPENVKVLYGSGFEVPKFKLVEGIYKPVCNEQMFAQKLKNHKSAICVEHVYEIIADLIYAYVTPRAEHNAEMQKYWVKESISYRMDSFEEELNICICTTEGLIIITGCAHRGLNNILDEAISITNNRNIRALIGGTHIQEDPVRLRSFYRIIHDYNIENVAPSHCTGFKSVAHLTNQYPERCLEFNTGKILTFEY